MTVTLAEAARERSQCVVQRADRPSRRRCDESRSAPAVARMAARVELREPGDGERIDFRGVATAYEHGYEMWDYFGPYTEVVEAGAGEPSLSRADLDVPLVLGHDQLRRIARTTTGTLTLVETDEGLQVDAPDLDIRDVDVAYIVPKLRAGLIDEMSFAFKIEQGQWSPDYSEYRIKRYNIHRGDVAIVGYGANPATLSSLRTPRRSDQRLRALLDLEIAR
jgi:uncharacterized protein